MLQDSYTDDLICLEIDFQDTENPARIFSALSDFVMAFNELDATLVQAVSPGLQTALHLEDVQKGSIRTFFRTALESLDDEGLKELDWKKIVGGYAIKAKYKALKMLQDNNGLPIDKSTGLPDRGKVEAVAAELQGMAEATDIRFIPAFSEISMQRLLNALFMVATALGKLDKKDKVSYIAGPSRVELSPTIVITLEMIAALLVKESKTTQQTLTLKVKRPDYLGDSQWEFKLGKNLIRAKITDSAWLRGFQERFIQVKPGDSLMVRAEVTVDYGFKGEIVSSFYNIFQVLEVMSMPAILQSSLLDMSNPQQEHKRQWFV